MVGKWMGGRANILKLCQNDFSLNYNTVINLFKKYLHCSVLASMWIIKISSVIICILLLAICLISSTIFFKQKVCILYNLVPVKQKFYNTVKAYLSGIELSGKLK